MDVKKSVFVERMHLLNGSGPTKAFCTLKLMDTFIIKGLRVVEGKEGLFVSMPQEVSKDGKWYDTFLPLDGEVRKALQKMVLAEYKETTSLS